MVFRPFAEEQFLHCGLGFRFQNDSWKRRKPDSQVAEFVGEFGVHPKALAAIWKDLQLARFMELRIDESVKPEHLLVVHRWLKAYESEASLRRNFGFGEHSIRTWLKDITLKIAGLRKMKVWHGERVDLSLCGRF